MGVTSLSIFDVTFCVFLLYPVNWTVAPRNESMSDPKNPAKRPARYRAQFFSTRGHLSGLSRGNLSAIRLLFQSSSSSRYYLGV